jgi:hypothetical protein
MIVNAWGEIPIDWQAMEVEAKWSTSASEIKKIKKIFKDGSQKYGYNINVRWGGQERKFVDVYYDNSIGMLSDELHVLRSRVEVTR